MTDEMILHPLADQFRAGLLRDPGHVLTHTWDIQAGRDRPDFEVLFGAGQITRQEQIAQVEDLLAAWLSASHSPRRWDVAACFLMGYWATPLLPGDALVDLLLRHLEHAGSHSPGWNEVLWALSKAAALSADGARAKRIRDALQAALARADPADVRPGTVSRCRSNGE